MITICADQIIASRILSRTSRAFTRALNRAYTVANDHATTAPPMSRRAAHASAQHPARVPTPTTARYVAGLSRVCSRRLKRSFRRAQQRVYHRAEERPVLRAECRVALRRAHALKNAPGTALRRALVCAFCPAYRWACLNA